MSEPYITEAGLAKVASREFSARYHVLAAKAFQIVPSKIDEDRILIMYLSYSLMERKLNSLPFDEYREFVGENLDALSDATRTPWKVELTPAEINQAIDKYEDEVTVEIEECLEVLSLNRDLLQVDGEDIDRPTVN